MGVEKLTPETIRQSAARFLPEGTALEGLALVEPTSFSSVQEFQTVGVGGTPLTVVSGIVNLSNLGQGLNDYLLHFYLPTDNSGTLYHPPSGDYSGTGILFPTHVYLYTPDGTPTTETWSINSFGVSVFAPPPPSGPPVFIALVVCDFSTYASTSAATYVLSIGFQVTIGLTR